MVSNLLNLYNETKLVYLLLYSKGSAYKLHKIMDSNI